MRVKSIFEKEIEQIQESVKISGAYTWVRSTENILDDVTPSPPKYASVYSNPVKGFTSLAMRRDPEYCAVIETLYLGFMESTETSGVRLRISNKIPAIVGLVQVMFPCFDYREYLTVCAKSLITSLKGKHLIFEDGECYCFKNEFGDRIADFRLRRNIPNSSSKR
jgi:hypothetical protein